MSAGPKRVSLSDYKSKRGSRTRSAIAAAADEEDMSSAQKTELEELHILLGTSINTNTNEEGNDENKDDAMAVDEVDDLPRTPGDNFSDSDDNGSKKRARRSSRRRRRRGNSESESESRSRSRSMSRSQSRSRSRNRGRGSRRDEDDEDDKSSRRHRHHRHRHHHHRRRSRRERASRSRSPSYSRSRSRSRSYSPSRSRSQSRSGRSRRHGSSHRNRSRSVSPGEVKVRCVFPYEDGGVIIGLRGSHLSKLRRKVPSVDWRISNETNDRQDRVLVVRGTIKNIAEAFKELAEHFISQGMHIDYPPPNQGRGSKDVDTEKPLIPIRLLVPHKTCGAIIGQRSETLINTRVNCAARRVYVYRERISDSRERVVEIVGTPDAISSVMVVLGEQIARTLSSDQHESEPYLPERDGLRRFLIKQGVPRSRVNLEPINPASSGGEKKDSKAGGGGRGSRRKRRRRKAGGDRDSEGSRSRSRNHHDREHCRSSRHHHRSKSRSRSRSKSGDKQRSSNKRGVAARSRSKSADNGEGGKRNRKRDEETNGKDKKQNDDGTDVDMADAVTGDGGSGNDGADE